MSLTFAKVEAGYSNLWAKCVVRPEKAKELDAAVKLTILPYVGEYEKVEKATGVPRWVVGCIDQMEGGGRAKTYLGNGQSLNRRTTEVPAGRGPFNSFLEGAIDALHLDGLDKIKDWSIPRFLFAAESYNGLAYYSHGVNSPYVWASTNLYGDPPNVGKYVADHQWSSSAVSRQNGVAAILKTWVKLDPKILGGVTVAPPTDPTVSHHDFQDSLTKIFGEAGSAKRTAVNFIFGGGVGGDVVTGLEILAGTRKGKS